MGFPGYFLIVSDFIKWSKENDIPVGPGRGSGAGSIVAWVLEITDLDPIRFGLLFERFLNPERVSMPDFDIDFCQEKRELVINYVAEKYGSNKLAQIITFGKLQAKAVLKDVGRVLQIPYNKVDQICKMIPFNPVSPITLSDAISLDSTLKRAVKEDVEIEKLFNIALKLEGLHRHSSTHAAGVVIANQELLGAVPLYKDQKSEIPVVGYSMKYTELSGLVKFDFLGLKTLTTIAKTLKILEKKNISLDIYNIPLDDIDTYEMLATGETIGIFQLESAGMRDCLKKMVPDKIEDIIALISLYRPGPMENIPQYIAVKHGRSEPEYYHPLIKDCLTETFGVIIYQEQVMQIARDLAKYSLGQADLLRRAMGKKIKKEMDNQREVFVKGCLENNIAKDKAVEIFELLAKFAGYGFNKSHAAAYALIGYQTAYLKTHYPVEFITATLNVDYNDTDKINLFIQEAKKLNITILVPDINKSQTLFSIEEYEGKKAIRYGLVALKSVGIVVIETVIKNRDEQGEFKDLSDFLTRLGGKIVQKKLLESFIKSGVLDDFNEHRNKLLLNLNMLLKYAIQAEKERNSKQHSLFAEDASFSKIELLEERKFLNAELLQTEFEAIGFYLTRHPMDGYEAIIKKRNITSSSQIKNIKEEKKRYRDYRSDY